MNACPPCATAMRQRWACSEADANQRSHSRVLSAHIDACMRCACAFAHTINDIQMVLSCVPFLCISGREYMIGMSVPSDDDVEATDTDNGVYACAAPALRAFVLFKPRACRAHLPTMRLRCGPQMLTCSSLSHASPRPCVCMCTPQNCSRDGRLRSTMLLSKCSERNLTNSRARKQATCRVRVCGLVWVVALYSTHSGVWAILMRMCACVRGPYWAWAWAWGLCHSTELLCEGYRSV